MHDVEDVARFMRQQSLVLTTAESCTAGLIAAILADVPGAGQALDCAFVVYSVKAKQQLLGVSPETIERHNLTSEEVAREMAVGALKRSNANVAIADTGVADNSTDDDVPSGTQCFAWAFNLLPGSGENNIALFSETRRFAGDRNQVRDAAARYALSRVVHYVNELDTPHRIRPVMTES